MKKYLVVLMGLLVCAGAGAGSRGLEGVRATSVLKAQGKNTYGAANAADGNLATAWVEGKPGPGIGEKILFSVSWEAHQVTAIRVYPGYGKNQEAFYDNSRVKRAKLSLYLNECCNEICPPDNDGPECECNEFDIPHYQEWSKEVTFKDEMSFQTVDVPPYTTCEGDPCCAWLSLEILDVYPGAKWSDTAVSEVEIRYKGR